MRRRITAVATSAVAVLVCLAPAAGAGTAPAAAAPAAKAKIIDQRLNACAPLRGGGCAQGAVVTYWYHRGSRTRSLSWVYASREPVSKGRTYMARWSYREPGGSWHTSAWKRLTHVPRSDFAEVGWGKGGRTGRAYARGTEVCIQHKGLSPSTCFTLK
ncbi:hypothetical protein ACF053_29615 [Streptomyces kanasensis]|uniref:hypothetical protein n=1 Tax=Streptomyces kanasensis TaxID=936756 RepID=UPI0036F6F052